MSQYVLTVTTTHFFRADSMEAAKAYAVNPKPIDLLMSDHTIVLACKDTGEEEDITHAWFQAQEKALDERRRSGCD